MDHRFDVLLLYGGYSIWPTDHLEEREDDLPDPPADLVPGVVRAVHAGAFVLCVGGDTGSAGDVRLVVHDEARTGDGLPGAAAVELRTGTGSVSLVSFDLDLIGTVRVAPGRHRLEVRIATRDETASGVETHHLTITSLVGPGAASQLPE